MKKIILNLAISLDGYIEGPAGEYEWCLTDQDYGMTAFMRDVDTVFIGRKSYQMMQQFEGGLFKGLKVYVFSGSLVEVKEGIVVGKDEWEKEVDQIKRQAGKNIWFFGGAELANSFFNAGLIDEMLLSVHPLILGNGKLLFGKLDRRIPYQLVNAKTYNTGLVQLAYRL